MTPPTQLIAFRDGSYKKVRPVSWKHSQWIHYTLKDGSVVMVNPANVNYIHRKAEAPKEPTLEEIMMAPEKVYGVK